MKASVTLAFSAVTLEAKYKQHFSKRRCKRLCKWLYLLLWTYGLCYAIPTWWMVRAMCYKGLCVIRGMCYEGFNCKMCLHLYAPLSDCHRWTTFGHGASGIRDRIIVWAVTSRFVEEHIQIQFLNFVVVHVKSWCVTIHNETYKCKHDVVCANSNSPSRDVACLIHKSSQRTWWKGGLLRCSPVCKLISRSRYMVLYGLHLLIRYCCLKG